MQKYEIGSIEWQEKFHQCLDKEFANPHYFAVHDLLVISYMIQCDAYNDDIKERVYSILKEFNNSRNPNEIMKNRKKWFENIPIRKQSNCMNNYANRWKTTIMDIRIDTPENYCNDVKKWAKEIEEIICTV